MTVSLSETLWLERDWHETSLYNGTFRFFGPLIVWLARYALPWVWTVWIEWPCMNKMELWFMSFNMRWAWCLYGVIHGIKMMGLVWIWHETWVKVDQWMWHGAGRKYTSTFVIYEGWVEWIQYEIQVRMDCKGWHDMYIYIYICMCMLNSIGLIMIGLC